MRYVIRCRVSGGGTDTRESIVKLNDEVRTFDTIEEAETEAALLNEEMNRNSAGYFRYWAEEKL
jgi:hypothetical protein